MESNHPNINGFANRLKIVLYFQGNDSSWEQLQEVQVSKYLLIVDGLYIANEFHSSRAIYHVIYHVPWIHHPRPTLSNL